MKSWFLHSTTILWARLQILAAALWSALSVADLTPLLGPKWIPVWLVISGTITELTRRRTLEKE
jgi:hypothetical protein